ARGFAADGASWMHIVDLDGAKEGRPVQEKLVGEIARASGLRVEVGGGVRTADDVRRLLAAGAERVVVGTKAIEDWKWFESLLADGEFHQRIVLAIDAKDGVVATRGWTQSSGRLATDVAATVSAMPVAALLYTDVAHDGMLDGPNVKATAALARAGKVPVIASGGVGRIEHVQSLVGLGIWGVVIGRSLYEGRVNLREAIQIGSVDSL
ncbi:MAG: 1-(5-phosphoribosyl)-5-((5-phosphoribosylamino)methylideneamino)imidazole-4-carboxamide isomerase, partial [Phycisphaerae bacterium]|nr:1-(5-phosphoribosyl)-5-((5-phosphoribosylamino)methylideneamino)imidazole-4-carboxamide isomerase [Phycisphaerae bacterium]